MITKRLEVYLAHFTTTNLFEHSRGFRGIFFKISLLHTTNFSCHN